MTETPTGPLLSIGVFSRRSRLSPKALRLYDQLGVLQPHAVDEGNGYRWYRESQLGAARLVAMLRRLGMPLEQVGEVLASPAPANAQVISSYWEGVERRVASQRELVAHLQATLSGAGTDSRLPPVRRRAVPAQTVLTERRNLHVGELAGWLQRTMSRLAQTADDHGGMVAPTFVIYHGEVDEDSDGPVEVCAPICPEAKLAPGAALRREAAHQEAYVRLVKARVEYPQILSAFDAVAGWIPVHGHQVTGPPREVYFADWWSAGPTDEVCDVAFPIR